jgi:hypothetical protein
MCVINANMFDSILLLFVAKGSDFGKLATLSSQWFCVAAGLRKTPGLKIANQHTPIGCG